MILPGCVEQKEESIQERVTTTATPYESETAQTQMVEGVSKYPSPGINMLMITAWNEFAEGSVIEPTKENGFAYLEALKDVVQASSA